MAIVTRKIHYASLLCFLLAVIVQTEAQSKLNIPNTSFSPGAIWPDNNGLHINAHGGGIWYQNGIYYWFGEHKIEGKKGNSAQVGVHCYSSKDLYNWADEGVVLKVSDDPKSDITKGSIIERPKVVYNKETKKYVMWFHLELKGKGYAAALAGVAVSDKITGPYQYLKSLRANAGKMPFYPHGTPETEKVNCADTFNKANKFFYRDFAGGQMVRDMTIFMDDNGKAYHVFSSEENYTLQIAELDAGYTGYTGKFARVYIGHQTEAPALFKRNGIYYMIGSGCTGWAPNEARWFTAASIWGPWTFHGNPCKGPDAQLTFNGQSTFVLPVEGKKDAFIFMADKWEPQNAIDGRYLWLPILFKDDDIQINWLDKWNLQIFDQ
ncbi:family 43 glycosylhydrolase [Mucilaginibacter ginsenosidivorans]|uniref:Family 43 glycosylhydrolase n=1 Tax=Mucilaginibacter ginsenosidivorans TaxID=398053 RepID=A0A5B8V520_9SPHI|nr:family 43 glycosylhydrolase [Mucilaginibacter ginsenosidivorans]